MPSDPQTSEYDEYDEGHYVEHEGGPDFEPGLFVDADADDDPVTEPGGWVRFSPHEESDTSERRERVARGYAFLQASLAPEQMPRTLLRLLQSGQPFLTTFFGNVVANRVALARKKVRDNFDSFGRA